MKLQPVYISIDNNYMIHNTPHIPVRPSQWDPSQWDPSQWGEIINKLAVGLVVSGAPGNCRYSTIKKR